MALKTQNILEQLSRVSNPLNCLTVMPETLDSAAFVILEESFLGIETK
jgi:hypothetical protein